MIEFEVDFRGYEEQMKRLERFAPIADPHLADAMRKATLDVVSQVRPLTPVFMGTLRNSIASEIRREGPLAITGIVGSTLRDEVYPSVMEFGRKPGTMPPPEALERWVELKLRVPDNEVSQVAWNVARKIKAHGIPGHFFMKKGWEKARSRIPAYFEQAMQAIARDLSIGGE